MGRTAAVATAVAGVLLVGLPLLAVLASRSRGWSRLRPGRVGESWTEVARRNGLTGLQTHELAAHLGRTQQWPWGAPPGDPVLRTAGVDWLGWGLRGAEERAARPALRGVLSRDVEWPWRRHRRRQLRTWSAAHDRGTVAR